MRNSFFLYFPYMSSKGCSIYDIVTVTLAIWRETSSTNCTITQFSNRNKWAFYWHVIHLFSLTNRHLTPLNFRHIFLIFTLCSLEPSGKNLTFWIKPSCFQMIPVRESDPWSSPHFRTYAFSRSTRFRCEYWYFLVSMKLRARERLA